MSRIEKYEYYLGIAKAASKRSTCLKRHYGAVIVKNDEVIATGYNGSPRGCINCCDVGKCNRLEKPHNSGDYSDCHSVHAEQNAMISASRNEMQDSVMYLYGEEFGKGLFVGTMEWNEIKNPEPCPICARMLLNAGIKYIFNNENMISVKDFI